MKFSKKKSTTVYPPRKLVTVCRDRKFDVRDPKRLAVHEIGVHALRAANGYVQPFRLLALGLPGYINTEEGLTSYFEDLTGTMRNNTKRNYAALVIAVDSVARGFEFRQTFDLMRSAGFGENKSWNLSYRVHRGGGYLKDHVYLEGYFRIRDFAKKHDLKTLYVGKMGIGDIPVYELPPAIVTHGGPGTLAVGFYTEPVE